MGQSLHAATPEVGILSRQGELFIGGPPQGFLQKFHPAARVLLLLALLLTISFTHNPLGLAAIFAGSMAVAIGAFLNLRSIYRLMVVPLIFMALPSWLVSVIWYKLSYASGIPFFLRTLASASVGSVMLHSLGLRNVESVFSWLRLPADLRQTWTIMINQVYGFSDLLLQMGFAREARSVHRRKNSMVRRQIGGQMGILFARTYQRGTELGLAIESRNISADPALRSVNESRSWNSCDSMLVIAAITGSVLAVVL